MNGGGSVLLDPWRDAERIAALLQPPGAELAVVIGATAWCERCRRLQPIFQARAFELLASGAALWLDLEDHAEFIGPHVPDDLPLLLRWRAGVCVQAAVMEEVGASGVWRLREIAVPADLPALWAVFSPASC